MALTGTDPAYLQARSGIARSGAIRSNCVFPLFAVVTVNGVDLTASIRYGSLRVTLALNEQPDTASFDVMLTDSTAQAELVVGADVLIGLGGAAENPIFGGRILTTQTTRGPARTPSLRSVMCADYLQVLDSEYLITYDWPAQSATTTIVDLIARCSGKAGGVVISTAGVAAGLPSHAAFGVVSERFSTVLRRLVTMFPTGGGYYVDPLKGLRVWAGAAEPNLVHPSIVTLDNPLVKTFAEVEDGSQQRDAVIVEGARTTAPMGTAWDPATNPAFLLSLPVLDASILDKVTDVMPRREVRIGTQRLLARYAEGAWTSPPGTTQTAIVSDDAVFPPLPAPTIYVDSTACLTGRNMPWIRIDEQYLRVTAYSAAGVSPAFVKVPQTGFGAMIGPVKAGAVVTAIDSFGDLVTTGRYDAPGSLERIRPQAIACDVVLTVRSATGDAIHEQLVQDGRFSRSGAAARGAREVQDFDQALIAIEYETEDLNAKPGRRQAYSLVDPGLTPMVGEYMILTAELSWPVWGLPPRRRCRAADVSTASVVDTWITDPR